MIPVSLIFIVITFKEDEFIGGSAASPSFLVMYTPECVDYSSGD